MTYRMVRLYSTAFSSALPVSSNATPFAAKSSDPQSKRNALFSDEQDRQGRLLTKVHKIEVNVVGLPKNGTCKLMMNKDVSTPLHCSFHINRSLSQYAALALVNNKVWDMNRPLTEDCQLQYLHYTDANPILVNQAYWRTCSFILGYILETAFKNQYKVTLHSWPSSNFQSGSFVYDALIDIPDWTPSEAELKVLSKVPSQELRNEQTPFESLDVDIAVAEKILEDNPFKLEQLKFISKHSSKVTLYRMGNHVDISKGPMISHTRQLGIYSVIAFHKFDSEFGLLHRVQGVSVPFTQFVNSWTWEVLCKSAKPMNALPTPSRRRYEMQMKT